jgi:gliding motility-associated-like protein
MKQLEDKLKDAFDHFEPEVSPEVWTKISQQLPAAPSPVQPGPAASSKGLLSQLGIKGIVAIIAATAITVVSVMYFNGDSGTATTSQPTPETTSITGETTTSVPQEVTTQTENSTASSQGLTNATTNSSTLPSQETSTEEHPVTDHSSVASAPAIVPSSTSTEATPARQAAAPVVTEPAKATQANTVRPQPVNTNPSPVLIVSTEGGFAPLTVTAMTNQQGKTADFDFGDGKAVLNSTSTSHTYAEPGDYTLQCNVDGINLVKTIHVTGQIPSAFSPNADGVNDLFEIENSEGISLEIRIFTRTGKLIYSNKGAEIRWDGRLTDGQPAESGTYLYDIFATSQSGSSWKQKGTIHLFR